MKGISRLLNKKCKRFKHHIRNILQNDIANKYINLPPPPHPHPHNPKQTTKSLQKEG